MPLEDLCPSIWNLFHDGSICLIEGTVAGQVKFHVDIEYLHTRFDDPGTLFIATFPECHSLQYQPYDSTEVVKDSELVGEQYLPILTAESDGADCKVFMESGVMTMPCVQGSLALDSGREVSLAELDLVAKDYWDKWSSGKSDSKE